MKLAAITLVSSDDYVEGTCVLGFTLRENGWRQATEALVTPNVSAESRATLSRWWGKVSEVEPLGSPQSGELCWSPTVASYTKLKIWTKTEYERLIYLDADMLVLGSLDEALERPRFAAAPCIWPPDRFNAGLLVLEPSEELFADMLERHTSLASYDTGDQGFLNSYFHDWYAGPAEHRLPAKFNASVFLYLYSACWRSMLEDIRVLHFTGPRKPWQTRSPFLRRVQRALQQRVVRTAGGGPDPHSLWWAARERMGA